MRSRNGWLGNNGDSLWRLVVRFVINAVAIWVASRIIPGITPLSPLARPEPLLVVALIFGAVNALIKPVFELITCPLEILTLGLFTLIINAAMLGLTSWIAQQLAIGFQVDGLAAAFLGALVISVVSWLLTRLA
jgi:putative membrane protein